MKVFYKIRHKPTSLFYKPSKHRSKLNLSKDGKTYNRKPSFKNIGRSIRIRPNPEYDSGLRRQWNFPEYITEDFIPENWEIVKYEVVEAEVIPYGE